MSEDEKETLRKVSALRGMSKLIADIHGLINKARRDAAIAVNVELTMLYWSWRKAQPRPRKRMGKLWQADCRISVTAIEE